MSRKIITVGDLMEALSEFPKTSKVEVHTTAIVNGEYVSIAPKKNDGIQLYVYDNDGVINITQDKQRDMEIQGLSWL